MTLPNSLLRPTPPVWTVLIVLAIAGNIVLEQVSRYLALPLFMDTFFTVIAAISGGFAATVVVGVGTNTMLEILPGPQLVYAPFVLNNVLTGVLVWLFVRYDYFHKPIHAVAATLIVAGLNSALGAFFSSVFLSGGGTHTIHHITTGIMLTGHSATMSSFLARIPINTVDKGIAVFAAYFVYTKLIRRQAKQQDSTEFPEYDQHR